VGGGAFDISLIATFHREGYIAGWMLDNLVRVRHEADVAGLSHELICVLDKADSETISAVEGHAGLRPQDSVAKVDHGDPGTSRNEGVSRACGEFVATFDGDDYCSREWLTKAYRVMAAEPATRIVHPEFIVSFGDRHCVERTLDQEKDVVPREALLLINPWGSCVLAARHAMASCPYLSTCAESTGFGFEDWHWNLEMLARGFKFVVAPGTALYYRRKAKSILDQELSGNAIVRPSAFFRLKSGAGRAP
jgi:hypothetical protein